MSLGEGGEPDRQTTPADDADRAGLPLLAGIEGKFWVMGESDGMGDAELAEPAVFEAQGRGPRNNADFVAIDVETANADMASICQVGLASYLRGVLIREWKSYVDPEDFFDSWNVSIHGIDEATVTDAPRLPEIAAEVVSQIRDRVVVCHTHFDRTAVRRAFAKYRLAPPDCVWLDSARVTRRAWNELAWGGYNLRNVCSHIGYEFAPHDALEDAKAAAQVLLAAIQATGLSVGDWLVRVEQPIGSLSGLGHSVARRGNPEGPFFGEVIVFTGALLFLLRQEAATLADGVGCEVCDSVTKRTTILVVGDQDIWRLAGHEKSSKHRRAETLIAQGQAIRIVRESDFVELVASVPGGMSPEQYADWASLAAGGG